jgi:hypothetical protein
MRPRLVFLETSDIAARYTAEAARGLGFEPLFLCHLKNYQADTLKQIKAYDHVDISTEDPKNILNFLKTTNHVIGGVVSLLDSYLHISSEVATALGCPGLDPAVIRLKDKAEVVDLVSEFSPRTLRFSRTAPKRDELAALLDEACKNEILLKPRFTAGALGLLSLKNHEELAAALSKINDIELPSHLMPDSWIAQEKIHGSLVSCEGYVENGIVNIIGFTGSLKVKNTQSKLIFPSDLAISANAKKTAQVAIEALVDRSGYRNGYFHTEFIVGHESAHLIDANFGRIGGGSVGELIALAADRDPIDIFTHFLALTLFGRTPFELKNSNLKTSARSYLYGIEKESTLIKLEVPQGDGIFYHTRLLDDGAQVPAMGENNWAWVGILTAPSDKLDEAFEKIRIQTEAGWTKPIC